MSADIALEEIVGELLILSKRKPLREKDHAKAKELMVRLKEMGFTNQQISELTDGGWSESTVKVNTRGTVVRNPGPKENAMKLITQLVNMDLTLEDVGSSISMKEDLDAKGLVFEDITSLLKETKKNKVDPKDLIQLDKDLKESKLTFPQLREAISYRSELKKAGITLEGIKKIHQTSKTYGGYDEVLGAINAYGSLVSIEAEINKKTPLKKSLEKQVGDLNLKIGNLKEEKEQIKGALQLHKELEDLGFDKATLQELKKSSENYGKVKEVLAMVNTYTNLAELKTKVEELEKEKKDVESDLKKVQADHAHFQSVLGMCNTLIYKYKFSVPAITDIYKMAKEYGEPIEVIKAIGKYKELKMIEKDIEEISTKKSELEEKVKELNDQVQTLRALSKELKNTAKGLLKPFSEDLSKSVELMDDKFSKAFDNVSSKYQKVVDTLSSQYEQYAKRFGELNKDAGRLEEELRLARVLQALIKYPSETKDIPQDYAILMLRGIKNNCLAKGINPKFKLGDLIPKTYVSSSVEVNLMDFLDWALEGLTSSLGPSG